MEESGVFGGISRTVNYKGNRMDMGGHRFFSKMDEVNDWWKNLLPNQGCPSLDDILLKRSVALEDKIFRKITTPIALFKILIYIIGAVKF